MSDIFDEIELKDIFSEVESDRIADKIFEDVEKELPSIVRTYVKEQTKKIKTLTPQEISRLVDAAISGIPKPKPDRIIERTIEKVQVVPKKETKKYIEETQLEELKKQIEELKRLIKREPDIRIIGNMLPNYSGKPGNLYSDGKKIDWVASSSASGSNPMYIGDPTTEGSWRIYDDGVNLLVQRLESSTWVEKSSFLS